ncbi:MAG: LacI family DNA-binding transcriptional regulator [Acidimicrobiales bacterium]|nr:LacI family DNA-binding transcriptional regulator [Acidimicrobiales bacterium]
MKQPLLKQPPRTLSRPEFVSPLTRERVLRAVEELGYVPNLAARQLAGGKSASIAIIVPDITNPFFAAIVHHTQRKARATNRLVLFADSSRSAVEEREATSSLARNVDGIIICAPISSTKSLISLSRGVPIVFVNKKAEGISSITIDQELTVKLAIEHLIEQGHNQIAFVPGPKSSWSSRIRLRALAAVKNDYPLLKVTLLKSYEPDFEGGQQCALDIKSTKVSGLVAFNDFQALGIITKSMSLGMAIPDDLSVVGADGLPFGETMLPNLTTVAAPLREVGELALDLLDNEINGFTNKSIKISPHLIKRASTSIFQKGNRGNSS